MWIDSHSVMQFILALNRLQKGLVEGLGKRAILILNSKSEKYRDSFSPHAVELSVFFKYSFNLPPTQTSKIIFKTSMRDIRLSRKI